MKLRGLWPGGTAECLVAGLDVRISDQDHRLARLLDQVAAARRSTNPEAALPPARTR